MSETTDLLRAGRLPTGSIEPARIIGMGPFWEFVRRLAVYLSRFLAAQFHDLQHPSLGAEWAWVAGRIGVIAVCYPAAYLFMRGTGGDLFVYGLATFAGLYNVGIGVLLNRGRVKGAFLAGLFLDNATLLAGWWGVTWSLAGSTQTHDLYLVIFPILVIGVVRLGGFFGAIYTVGWLAWITWVNLYYYGPDAYDVQQLPVRIPLIAVTSLLTVRVVSRLNAERRRAEDLQNETAILAEVGRAAGSTLDLRAVYERLTALSSRLLPFDRLLICTVDESVGAIAIEFDSGVPVVGPGDGAARPIVSAYLRRAVEARRALVVGERESSEFQRRRSRQDGAARGDAEGVRAMLIAPVVAGDQAIAVLVAQSAVDGAFGERHVHLAGAIATNIAGALVNARSYRQAVQLAEERGLRIRLDAANRDLQRVNEERAQFVSAVTHELKTPLASIIAFNDLLLKNRQANLTERDMQHLAIMRRNAERLNEMTADLLDVSRVQAGNLTLESERFDVGQLVPEIVESFGPILNGKRQRLAVNVAKAAVVAADRARITQVISNLLSNASKYSPASSEILLRVWTDDYLVHVSVRDQGIGISREDRGKLFTAFFRAANSDTRAQQGTGLGLVISKGIVEAHGGTIEVHSEVGIGTTVEFALPAALPRR